MKMLLNTLFRAMSGVLLCFMAGCGSGGDGVGVPTALVSLQVTPTEPNIEFGMTRQLTATGIYSNGTGRDLTASATWSSSTSTVATVSNIAGSRGLVTTVSSNNAVATVANVPKKNKGLATGVSAGPVTIKATLSKGAGGGTSGTATLTVK